MSEEASRAGWPAAGRRAIAACLASALALLAVLGLSAPAQADAPPQLWQRCGSGDPEIQCSNNPRGIAANREDGHVYLAEQASRRIDEFDAVGNFVKAWGWGVRDGSAELQTCTAETGCLSGSGGGDPGKFNGLHGLAVDSAGNVWANDRNNRRVQKFSPEGEFLLMIGGEVNKTTTADVCTKTDVEGGEECGAGTTGTEPGEFGAWPVGDFIEIDDEGTATDADDKVWVGDIGRIQRFDVGGAFQGEIALPGETVQSLAVDPDGNLYAADETGPNVLKLNPAGSEVCTLEVERPTGVAADRFGSVHAINQGVFGSGPPLQIVQFDSSTCAETDRWEPEGFGLNSTGIATNHCAGSEPPGNLYLSEPDADFLRAYGTEPAGCVKARTGKADMIAETTATLNGEVEPDGMPVTGCAFEYGTTESYGEVAPCAQEGSIGEGSEPVPVDAEIGGLEPGTVYHFRLRATVGGQLEEGFDETFKTLGPPVISDEHLVRATASEATVKALVNPEGFASTYRFEYVTLADFNATGFEGSLSTPTQSVGSDGDRADHPASAVIGGLSPGTEYRWRLVATNSSGASEGEAQDLTTYRAFAPRTDCPNQALRAGDSASLPDCRAYEMVSPVDKNGADIIAGRPFNFDPGGYLQAAPDGERIAFGSRGAFAGQPGHVQIGEYLSTRRAGDSWSTEGIQPPLHGESSGGGVSFGITREFMAFTPDLCSAWLIDFQTPAPTADGQEGRRNLYRRDNCAPGAGGLEALTPEPPALPEGAPIIYVDHESVQGISEDGRHALFTAKAPLPHAAQSNPGANTQVYDRFAGQVSLVSVLPGGMPNPTNAAVGSGWRENIAGAVSADGSRVYWTAGVAPGETGTIYRRAHPEQGVVAGECDAEGAKACTVQVSPSGPTLGEAFFWAASPDGSRALFAQTNVESNNLRLFDDSAPLRTVAADVEGVAGASEDLSRIYFVSEDVMAPGGTAGEPNLYLDQDEEIEFVATLMPGDVGAHEPGVEAIAYDLAGRNPSTYYRATRVTPDGSRIVFQSRAPLTDFDNRDGEGRRLVEVYSYEAGGELSCLSCNPSGARPQGRELLEPYVLRTGFPRRTNVHAAAWIPTWQHPLHASNVLSADGGRVFFNSNDPLVPRDRNGAQDVYQWEAPGSGDCAESAPSFREANDGCVQLISSGQSSHESEFWEASRDGDDVFFTTASSLVRKDPGLVDLYDARVGGGLPQPSEPAACEGEACQSPAPPPRYETPASATYTGPGNELALRNCAAPARRAARLSRRAKRLRRAARASSRPALSKRRRVRAKRSARAARRLSRGAKRCRRANRKARAAR